MELEILDTYIVESGDDVEYEKHMQKVRERVNELEPEYYSIETDIFISTLRTKITVMQSVQ